jgi:hypothetical protein
MWPGDLPTEGSGLREDQEGQGEDEEREERQERVLQPLPATRARQAAGRVRAEAG